MGDYWSDVQKHNGYGAWLVQEDERKQREENARKQQEVWDRLRKQQQEDWKVTSDNRSYGCSYSSAPPRPWNQLNFIEKLFVMARNLVIYTILINIIGGIVLAILIDVTTPPAQPLADCSLELQNEWEVKWKEWESRKLYWKNEYNVNLEGVNQLCKTVNQNWKDLNLYLKDKFIYYWNKIDWEAVKQRLQSGFQYVADVIEQLNTPEEGVSSL